MKFYQLFLAVVLLSACQPAKFQSVYNGHGSEGFHSRGLAANDSLLFISGARGKVTIFDLNKLAVVDTFSMPASDFRGVELLKNQNLLLMNSGDDGILYRYNLKSNTADTVLSQPGAFYDALAIDKFGVGYLMGDPVEDKFTFYKTTDFGQTWIQLVNLPKPLQGEAGFAASNTGIAQFGSTVYVGTGASDTARLLKSNDKGVSWQAINTPLKSGGSYGIYSMSFWSATDGVIAGGSYVDKEMSDSICFITSDGGQSWVNISEGLPGYTSCVTSTEKGKLIVATGRLGVSLSFNKGKNWEQITNQPFYSAIIVGDYICLSGQNGTLAIYKQ